MVEATGSSSVTIAAALTSSSACFPIGPSAGHIRPRYVLEALRGAISVLLGIFSLMIGLYLRFSLLSLLLSVSTTCLLL